MPSPVHVVGGGLAGSEAAWQLARRGVPVVLHEMRPVRGDRGAPDRPPGRAGLLELVPLRRRDEQRGRPAARGDAPAGLADPGDGRPPQAAGGRSAGRRPGRFRGRGDRGAGGGPAGEHRARGGRHAPAAGLGPGHRRHRAAHLARPWPRTSAGSAARTSSPSSTPSRPSSTAKSIDLDVAWFQSRYDKAGPGGGTADYINCPLDRDQYDASSPRC